MGEPERFFGEKINLAESAAFPRTIFFSIRELISPSNRKIICSSSVSWTASISLSARFYCRSRERQ